MSALVIQSGMLSDKIVLSSCCRLDTTERSMQNR